MLDVCITPNNGKPCGRGIIQTNQGRYRITADYNDWARLPDKVVIQILWRSWATAQEAFDYLANEVNPHLI